MHTSEEKAAQVVILLQLGKSQREVARTLNLSRSSVQRVYRRHQEDGILHRRPGSGRPRCTEPRDDRFVVMSSLRNRQLTSVEVKQQLQMTRGVAVSRWTIARRLREQNLTSHRPANGPKLTAAHRQARMRFANEHVHWTDDDWKQVLFSDETKICLHGRDGRKRVFRRPGERFAQCCIEERVSYGGGSCMAWGGISFEARTELVIIERGVGGRAGRGLTAARYVEEILVHHVVPYAGFVGEEFTFMHDNARPHVAGVVTDFLDQVGIPTLDWPARSPDLNPIEHLWDNVKRRIRARVAAPTTIPELKEAFVEEWNNVPQEVVQNLILSMPNRIQAVIRARGGNTSY